MNQGSVRPRVWPWVTKAVVLAAAYFVVARVGLRYAAIGESISPVWPPTGLALAALLVLGPRYWPAVFAGRDAAGRRDHDRDEQRRAGRGLRRPARPGTAGAICVAGRERHRHRHGRGDSSASVRAVLHDQAARRGHR